MILPPGPPAAVQMRRFHRSLGVYLTWRCPLTCAHCSVESSPERDEMLDPSLVEAVAVACASGELQQVFVTGGEPFLAPALLRALLAPAQAHGVDFVVNTAAHWATDLERARAWLQRFPGITHLVVSADTYHEAFVPLAQVGHALRAAHSLNLVPELSVRVWAGEGDPFWQRVQAEFADILPGVHVDLGPLVVTGRANRLPDAEARRAPLRPELPLGACGLANQPGLDLDGTLLACCNQGAARRTPRLQLGHLGREPLAAISARADRDPLLQAIRVFGPAWLAEEVQRAGLGDRLAGAWRGICGLCEDLLSQPALVAALEARLAEPDVAADLAVARLMRLGEVGSLRALEEAQEETQERPVALSAHRSAQEPA